MNDRDSEAQWESATRRRTPRRCRAFEYFGAERTRSLKFPSRHVHGVYVDGEVHVFIQFEVLGDEVESAA